MGQREALGEKRQAFRNDGSRESYRDHARFGYCGTQVLGQINYSVGIDCLPDKLPRLDKIIVRATMKDIESLNVLQSNTEGLISI